MTTQEQDKLWNDLSEETREAYREKYKFHLADSKRVIKCNDGGYDLSVFRSQTIVKELENMFGSHNLNPTLTYEDIEQTLKETEGGREWIGTYFADKVNAIVMVLEVAKYLNGDWKPDWEYPEEKFGFYIDINNKLQITSTFETHSGIVYFRTEELAKQAIQILGEETIRLALSTDY